MFQHANSLWRDLKEYNSINKISNSRGNSHIGVNHTSGCFKVTFSIFRLTYDICKGALMSSTTKPHLLELS